MFQLNNLPDNHLDNPFLHQACGQLANPRHLHLNNLLCTQANNHLVNHLPSLHLVRQSNRSIDPLLNPHQNHLDNRPDSRWVNLLLNQVEILPFSLVGNHQVVLRDNLLVDPLDNLFCVQLASRQICQFLCQLCNHLQPPQRIQASNHLDNHIRNQPATQLYNPVLSQQISPLEYLACSLVLHQREFLANNHHVGQADSRLAPHQLFPQHFRQAILRLVKQL